MNLHAKAFSYSMEPCVRILCVRAGRVELRVGCPLLLFFCAPRESCFFSAGLDTVMQELTHVCVRASVHARVRSLNQMEWGMHFNKYTCIMRCYCKAAHSLPRVKCCILSGLKFVVSVRQDASCIAWWMMSCQLIASADLSSFRTTLHPGSDPSVHLSFGPQCGLLSRISNTSLRLNAGTNWRSWRIPEVDSSLTLLTHRHHLEIN